MLSAKVYLAKSDTSKFIQSQVRIAKILRELIGQYFRCEW